MGLPTRLNSTSIVWDYFSVNEEFMDAENTPESVTSTKKTAQQQGHFLLRLNDLKTSAGIFKINLFDPQLFFKLTRLQQLLSHRHFLPLSMGVLAEAQAPGVKRLVPWTISRCVVEISCIRKQVEPGCPLLEIGLAYKDGRQLGMGSWSKASWLCGALNEKVWW